MAVGRRELMMGLALAAGFRPVRAQRNIAQPFSTYGVVPRAGDQTAALQDAADQAAESGTPFFLPPGNYMSGKLELKSGTQIQGSPASRCSATPAGARSSRLRMPRISALPD